MSRIDYDAELQRHDAILRRSSGIRPTDRVLDIGCGAGQTTCDAARVATAGSALGIDVSAAMIERARRQSEGAGIDNVSFVHADAQTHRFAPESFDLAISRFGTMFFGDPVAAFTNVRRALRPAGRLVMMVWREHDRNEWAVLIERALGAVIDLSAEAGPDPFALADQAATGRILAAAGFAEPSFIDVSEPVYYGPDVAVALEWIRGFASVSRALARLDPASTELALERLRQAIAAHAGADGVWLGSSAWIVVTSRS